MEQQKEGRGRMSSHEWRINAGTRILITLLAIGCHSRWLDWLTLPRLKRRLTTATNRASKIQPSIWPVPCEDHPKLRQHEGERERGEERGEKWKVEVEEEGETLSPQPSALEEFFYSLLLFIVRSLFYLLFFVCLTRFQSCPSPFQSLFFIFFYFTSSPFLSLVSLSPPARLFYSLLLPPPPPTGRLDIRTKGFFLFNNPLALL